MKLSAVPLSIVILVILILSRVYKRRVDDNRFSKKYHVHPDVYEVDPRNLGTKPDGDNEYDVQEDEGLCPDIQRLDALVENFERTHEWELVLRVGDMYARGSFPRYAPDEFSALKIYKVASKCPDPKVSCEALSKYVDLKMNPLSSEDINGVPFPKQTSTRLIECVENHLKRIPLSQYMRRRRSMDVVSPRTIVSRGPDTVGNLGNVETVEIEGLDGIETEPVVAVNVVNHTPPYALDTQNVHDHGVSASVRENIKSVVKELGSETDYDRQEVIESVMKVLRDSGLPESDLNNAFRVVVSLVPDTINSVGCSQMDVLHATFKKIEKVRDPKIRKNLFESLGKNLASGVERGHVVCSTGKIGRIITTLEGIDQEELGGDDETKLQKSVPIDVVRNEIAILASKTRSDVLSESSPKKVADYEKFPSSPLSEEMGNRFHDEVKKVYIDGLHLSEKVLSPIIDMYSSVF